MICACCIVCILYIVYCALHLHLQLLTTRLRNLKSIMQPIAGNHIIFYTCSIINTNHNNENHP